jgi:hypothetical protein
MLGDPDLINKLRTFDKVRNRLFLFYLFILITAPAWFHLQDNIAPRIMQVITSQFIPNENFTPDKAAKASRAAAGLCKWVHAMVVYDQVIKGMHLSPAQLLPAALQCPSKLGYLCHSARALMKCILLC